MKITIEITPEEMLALAKPEDKLLEIALDALPDIDDIIREVEGK